MEWSPSGSFTDDPSFVAIHRNLPIPKYTVQNKNATVVISTARMKLKYKKGQGPFTKDNLTITSAKGMFPFQWTPGTIQKGNLKGTDRTLDGFEGDHNINKDFLDNILRFIFRNQIRPGKTQQLRKINIINFRETVFFHTIILL